MKLIVISVICISLSGCFLTTDIHPFSGGETTSKHIDPKNTNMALKNLLSPNRDRYVNGRCVEGEKHFFATGAWTKPKFCYVVINGKDYISRINKSTCAVMKLDTSREKWQHTRVRTKGDECIIPTSFRHMLNFLTHDKLVNELNSIS